ncbi:MAG TPA: creatininase family protein [Chthonomonadaceae bacterium]|nr:creatininase family protein [Chthonomonadaceae bacterium]
MKYGELNWTQIEDASHKVVVLPLGSLEQHGYHLPLLTDTMIGAEITRRAEEALGDEAVFLPMLWVGASDHHRAFPGTVSASNHVYVDLLVDMIESIIAGGFRRIFLLNSHGGNITPGRMAIYDVQLSHRDMPDLYLAFSSWWTLAAEQVAALTNVRQEMVTHACEQESSMILRLRPELVRMDAARGATIPFESAFYFPDFSRPSRVDVPRAFDQLSATGAFGHPELAEAEKGEALFSAAVEQVTAFVREFAEWPVFQPH